MLLVAVFRAGFFAVVAFDVAVDFVVDELADRHARVDAHGDGTGEFERPVAAESHVALSGSGVDVDTETASG